MPKLESSRPTSPIHTSYTTSMESFLPLFEKMGHAFYSTKPLRLETIKNASQNVRDWFHKFEIQTVQYDTQQKGYEVIKWLEVTALHFWSMIPSSQSYNYIHIKEHLIKKFMSTDQYFHSKA
jgi:hypothetical protein